MSFAEAIKTCFKKYADFSGRASRPEFWWFVLFFYLVILLPVVPWIAIDASSVNHAGFEEPGTTTAVAVFGVLVVVVFLALLIPYLAAGVRRLHDTGKSGWWWLISFVPFGSIVLIVFLVPEGNPGWNQYGPPPGVDRLETPSATTLPPPPPPSPPPPS